MARGNGMSGQVSRRVYMPQLMCCRSLRVCRGVVMLADGPGIKTLGREMARCRAKTFVGVFRKKGFEMAQWMYLGARADFAL